MRGKKQTMSTDDEHRGRRRGYHHGNLREALIRTALSLISKKGAAGFTIAEAARAAGVSPAAPYRHFKDRDALLADVASQGFDVFAKGLTEAWADGRPDARTAFKRLGQAYLAFARDEPSYFAAMFESGLSFKKFPALQEASDRAFKVLRDGCEALIATLPDTRRPPVMMMALHMWSLAHGIASLFARGDDARRSIPMEAEDLLEAAVLIYIDGIDG
jgi:AcrR family transcriptional regulator